MMKARRQVSIEIPIAIALAAFLLLLVSHSYTGFFIRYMADDYASANILKSRGLVGSQVEWYLSWSGRYAFTLAINLAELVGPKIVPFLPLAMLMGWTAAAAWATREVSQFFGRTLGWLAAGLAGIVVVLASLTSNSRLVQVLYWQTGLLTYPLPLALMTLYWAGFFRWVRLAMESEGSNKPVLHRNLIAAGSFLFSFFAGGFSETTGVLQVGLFAIAVMLCRLRKDRTLWKLTWPVFVAGLAGALLSMGVMGLAPGNTIRQVQTGSITRLDLWLIGKDAISTNIRLVYRWIVVRPFTAAGCLFIPLILNFTLPVKKNAFPQERLNTRQLLFCLAGIAVITFGLMVLGFLPAEVFLGGGPPFRAMLVTQFTLCTGVAMAGFLLGGAARQWISDTYLKIATISLYLVLGILLVFGPLAEARTTIIRAQLFRENAAAWDARDASLRAAVASGEQEVEVPFTRDIGHLGDLRAEPDFWINHDVAAYYGLESIRATGIVPPPIE